MAVLGDIAKIERNISSYPLRTIKVLYKIAFGAEGECRKLRKALRSFAGFNFEINSKDYHSKIEDVLNFEHADLITVCQILKLNFQGSVDEVAERIVTFLINLECEDVEIETEEDESEEENDDAGLVDVAHNGERDKIISNCEKPIKNERFSIEQNGSFSLTFRDVEDSIRTFNGDTEYPVKKWVEDFEEISQIAGWNDLQMLIFAKKSLGGLAKLYIQSEQGIKSWMMLKKLLIMEFEVKVSKIDVYKSLIARKMKRNESLYEYTLIMREMGSRADLEVDVIINCIIDGIDDDVTNKVILYGAKSFAEFKEKIRMYEQFKIAINHEKKNSKTYVSQNNQSTSNKNNSKIYDNNKVEFCYNCGSKSHKSSYCPDKAKGPKCFNCGDFGHISPSCPKKSESTQIIKPPSASVKQIEIDFKNRVTLKFENLQVNALLDTGSDISTLREDVYQSNFNEIPLDKNKIILKGIGLNKVRTLGSFHRTVHVNDIEVPLTFHVIPNYCTNIPAIIGTDILHYTDLHITEDGIIINSKDNESNLLLINTINVEGEDDIVLDHIKNESNKEAIKTLIKDYKPLKTKSTDIKLKIVLKDEEPIYQSPRRLSAPEKLEVEKQIQLWLDNGIIRPCSSDFASPIVLVKKKDGTTRICCDYRKLNKKIMKDRYPLPLIEDILDKLQGARVFTTLDLKNGFFHVDVDEESRKYTSFVTHNGQYEFLKCPFGLCNSPSVFQRYINHIFRPLTIKDIAIPYMDDIIIPSSDETEGIEKLKIVLDTASQYGLEIKVSKCQYLKNKIEFLGFIIKEGIITMSTSKSDAVRNFPEPRNCKQLQQFLGLTGYFRKFIQSYATISKPLSDLLRKEQDFHFEEIQRNSFLELKRLLTSEPVLYIFKQGRETELHTDASKYGYGACLLQKSDVDDKLHPIYYMSKKTTPAEEKYSSYQLEVLAVIQAVKKFRVYLLGNKFKLVTDCAAFQKTMEKKDLTTRVARWALLLEEYDYEIEHRSARRMNHVDALSRCPATILMIKEDGILHRIKIAQDKDEHIKSIKRILDTEDYENFFLKHELLYKLENGSEKLVVPRSMQAEVIKNAHQQGHFSVNKTKYLISKDFYIPKLNEKVLNCLKNCVSCILSSRKEGRKEGYLNPIPKEEGPLCTLHADHLGPLPSTNKNYRYILAVIDDFSKFTWLYPTKTVTAKETVDCFVKLQKDFGNPMRIITDKGTAFTAHEFQSYCENEGILHLSITTGVPRGNGQIERVNRTIIPVLTKLTISNPCHWYKYVDRVQMILNSTYQRSINTTPFEVLVGVKMRNKEDLLIKEAIENEVITIFNEQREDVRNECKEQMRKIANENRKTYNKRRRKPHNYNKGDLVAIKRTQFAPGLKFSTKYLGPYRVIKVNPHERYEVEKEGVHEGPILTSTCAEYMKPWLDCDSESDCFSDCEPGSDSQSDGRM